MVSSEPETQSPQRRNLRQIREWAVVLATSLLVAAGLRTFVVQQYYIAGPSMETTMFGDDRVLVNKLAYRFSDPSRGDVIVFDRITGNGDTVQHDDLIKRVIGLPGETVEIKDCVVLINGTPIDEPWLAAEMRDVTLDAGTRCGTAEMSASVVGAKQVFLMGDNRPMSFDSRMFGPIDIELIVGRAVVIIWPPSDMTML